MADGSNERVWRSKGDSVRGVFGTLTGSRGMDLVVVVWIFDMELSGTDADNGTWGLLAKA